MSIQATNDKEVYIFSCILFCYIVLIEISDDTNWWNEHILGLTKYFYGKRIFSKIYYSNLLCVIYIYCKRMNQKNNFLSQNIYIRKIINSFKLSVLL